MSNINRLIEDIENARGDEVDVDFDAIPAYIGRDYPEQYIPSLKELAE
jgi:hypothetical protein